MRRNMIGIIAIVLLWAAAALWIWPLELSWYEPLKAACSRLGPFMAVLWLAYNEVKRLPPWLMAMVPALVLVLAIRPRWFLIALPIVIALAILKPRAPSPR